MTLAGLTQKSLQRLFPCDQSMVVIIDDRADVWEWSPNLVKVIPCLYPFLLAFTYVAQRFGADDFFVGIGDINSAFLPKLEPMTPALPPEAVQPLKPASELLSTEDAVEVDMSSQATDISDPSTSVLGGALTPDESISFEESDQDQIAKNEILTRNYMELDQQVEERPLAKKQEELQEEAEPIPSTNGTPEPEKDGIVTETTPKPHARKALLKNDDIELTRVQNVRSDYLLSFIHSAYTVLS